MDLSVQESEAAASPVLHQLTLTFTTCAELKLIIHTAD